MKGGKSRGICSPCSGIVKKDVKSIKYEKKQLEPERKRLCIRRSINIPLIVSFLLGAILIYFIQQYITTDALLKEYEYRYAVVSELASCETHEKLIVQMEEEIVRLTGELEAISSTDQAEN